MTAYSCTVDARCWEWWQGWYARATERDIGLAEALLRLRVAALPESPDIEAVQKIEDAAKLLIRLRQRQWCEMVRAPFEFEFRPESIVAASPPTKSRRSPATLDDLEGMFS